ncbi:hypothetical protein LEP1GSC081_3466 [Leptospira kirschneri str. H1]|uniref:Uncharacterized protein n=1 Tax=Leptospira kirschneri str. H1 TaxID=1049966 RepID=A0A0E2B3I5_9LEPT|nr:hypothetical protein LEP1GSC081_3466 [Leptospira kirschneri str. H1]
MSLVITSKSNWIVGVQALQGNPYDGGCYQSDGKDCRSSSYVDVSKFQRLGLNLSKGSHKNVLF